MSKYLALSSLILIPTLATSSSSIPTNTSLTNHDLEVAIEEMKRANYFTFVLLINMALPNIIKPNITFLMPKDKTLAKTIFPENNISDFLLRHSIPSPLLFDHLVHIPTGSMIPTSRPELMLAISNNGRRSFYLSNVRLISPNLCTAGNSIRCHGIDGVIEPITIKGNDSSLSPPTCSSNSSSPMEPPLVEPPEMTVPPAMGRRWPPPPVSENGQTPPDVYLPPYQQEKPKRSGSSQGSGLRRFWSVFVGLIIDLAIPIVVCKGLW